MTTLKITTWNVNGYRAVLKKGFDTWIRSDEADVVCLQEIKAKPDQIDEAYQKWDGYQSFWNPAERPGYSGVVIFSRKEPIEYGFGLNDSRFDDEGRVIWLRFPEFTLFNIYFPNGQRGQDRVAYKLDFYARLLDICSDIHQKGEKIVITGDFNTAHNEIDLANPKQNSTTSGFLPEERAWVSRFLETGFTDAYRHLYPDRIQYTWWTFITNARARNVGWRLDYYLLSSGLMDMVKDVVIQDQVMGSDHCPVSLLIG